MTVQSCLQKSHPFAEATSPANPYHPLVHCRPATGQRRTARW